MTTVQQLLDAKDQDIYRVHPDDMVLDALKIMEKENIGSVLVEEGDMLVGIFTERHYARNVFLKGRASPKTPIREVMKTEVICVLPEQTVEACMALMTEKRVRHLPVLSDGQLLGVISIGDIVKNIISEQQFTIEQLEHYISG
jgi:CBS domain-containing protein